MCNIVKLVHMQVQATCGGMVGAMLESPASTQFMDRLGTPADLSPQKVILIMSGLMDKRKYIRAIHTVAHRLA